MHIPKGLKYSNDHEWVKIDGNKAYIGITDYAQHSLGSIVFVELPEETGIQVSKGDVLGVVESVKAASDIYYPVSGLIVETNENLADTPDLVNKAPYDSYMVVVELTNMEEIDSLLSPEDYEKICFGIEE